MRDTENRFQSLLKNQAAYLQGNETEHDIWEDIRVLENRIKSYIKSASEYQEKIRTVPINDAITVKGTK